jgi:hypothetical protein
MFLRNLGIRPQDHAVSESRRPQDHAVSESRRPQDLAVSESRRPQDHAVPESRRPQDHVSHNCAAGNLNWSGPFQLAGTVPTFRRSLVKRAGREQSKSF